MAYPYQEPATAINLAAGGVPDGDVGPAVAPCYQEYRGWELLVRQGQRVDPGELTLYEAADMLQGKMRNPCPQYGWIQFASKSLRASLRCWLESRPPRAKIYSGVVDGYRILTYLARAFVETRSGSGIAILHGLLASLVCNSFFKSW